MSARRLAALLAAAVLCALPCFAQTFRAADQVYLQAVGHVPGFTSDVTIANLSGDPVSVSLISTPVNVTYPSIRRRKDVIHLGPYERHEYEDFALNVMGITNGSGQVVFNACLEGADCSWHPELLGGGCGGPGQSSCPAGYFDPPISITKNYRDISVMSRINGQSFAGQPWHAYATSNAQASGLSEVFIAGIRNTSRYKTNIGFSNASEYSGTTLALTLFDGLTSEMISQTSVQLGPLANFQQSLSALFPVNRLSRMNINNMVNVYVTVAQQSVTVTNEAAAAGCPDGCPGFFAYGSMIDSVTHEATTLEAQYERALSYQTVQAIYTSQPEVRTSSSSLRTMAAAKVAPLQASPPLVYGLPPCAIVQVGNIFAVETMDPVSGSQVNSYFGAKELSSMREFYWRCGAVHFASPTVATKHVRLEKE